jgi:hypothetical protein
VAVGVGASEAGRVDVGDGATVVPVALGAGFDVKDGCAVAVGVVVGRNVAVAVGG